MENIFEKCLLCNHTELKILNRFSSSGLVQCQNCEFIFSRWIPSEKKIIDFYNQYPEYENRNDITSQRYRSLLGTFENFRLTNNLIDVGCGDGKFLDLAKEKKWNVYGTEYIDRFIERCTEAGIKMHRGKYSPLNYTENIFDVLIWIEVIEHINNPVQEILNFKKNLRPGGIVYLTTPNFNSLSRRLLNEKWNVIFYPEHLCYYTPTTLRKLFEQNGFRLIELKTTGISPGRILSSWKNRKSDRSKTDPTSSIRSTDQSLRETIEGNAILRFIKGGINYFLSLTNSGDSIKAIFQKIN
jgi:2-polyprenyl-3-methyl-5-hydroxy-6-metoxy-1,4-benzoquinol methylase